MSMAITMRTMYIIAGVPGDEMTFAMGVLEIKGIRDN